MGEGNGEKLGAGFLFLQKIGQNARRKLNMRSFFPLQEICESVLCKDAFDEILRNLEIHLARSKMVCLKFFEGVHAR